MSTFDSLVFVGVIFGLLTGISWLFWAGRRWYHLRLFDYHWAIFRELYKKYYPEPPVGEEADRMAHHGNRVLRHLPRLGDKPFGRSPGKNPKRDGLLSILPEVVAELEARGGNVFIVIWCGEPDNSWTVLKETLVRKAVDGSDELIDNIADEVHADRGGHVRIMEATPKPLRWREPFSMEWEDVGG